MDDDRPVDSARFVSRAGGDGARPRMVLFVDDNLALADNLVEIAETAGYEAACVGSAEEAIDWVARGGIGSIVTDLRLPGLDGIDLIDTIRRSGCAIPVAIITAYASDAVLERAKVIGIDHVLAKPLHPHQVICLVADFSRDD